MGRAYLNEGNIQMASVQMQRAHQLDPDNKEIVNTLGIIHLQLSEFKKAEELFLKALAIDNEFSDAYHNLGAIYINTGQWDKAIEHFKKALQNPLYKTAERSYHLLGVSYYRMGRTDLAIAAFKDSIKRSPSFALPYYGLSLAYNKAGRYADAASVISIAIETDSAYKGDKKRFMEDIKQRLLTAKGEDESDSRDYLEILRY
jgi:superkiller protein 3